MPCPICGNTHATVNQRGELYQVTCQRCGSFSMSSVARDDWNDHFSHKLTDRRRANVAGWLREHQNIYISIDELDFLFDIKAPSVPQRADKLLLELERRTNVIGNLIPIPNQMPDANDLMGLTWSTTPSEVIYLSFLYLSDEKGYLMTMGQHRSGVAISPKGFAYLEELRRTQRDSLIGFCAMWFDETLTPVWTDAIEPAIEAAGYDPKRIDRVEHNNRIDDEIIAMLRRSRFVVADFTGQRGGVYFESGFALGLNLPVIWTVRDDDLGTVQFDNRQYNFITWKIDNLADFLTKLQNRIEATIGQGPL